VLVVACSMLARARACHALVCGSLPFLSCVFCRGLDSKQLLQPRHATVTTTETWACGTSGTFKRVLALHIPFCETRFATVRTYLAPVCALVH